MILTRAHHRNQNAYQNMPIIKTVMHATHADRNKFEVIHAIIPAAIRAAIPHTGFSDMEKMAGTVITDSVT